MATPAGSAGKKPNKSASISTARKQLILREVTLNNGSLPTVYKATDREYADDYWQDPKSQDEIGSNRARFEAEGNAATFTFQRFPPKAATSQTHAPAATTPASVAHAASNTTSAAHVVPVVPVTGNLPTTLPASGLKGPVVGLQRSRGATGSVRQLVNRFEQKSQLPPRAPTSSPHIHGAVSDPPGLSTAGSDTRPSTRADVEMPTLPMDDDVPPPSPMNEDLPLPPPIDDYEPTMDPVSFNNLAFRPSSPADETMTNDAQPAQSAAYQPTTDMDDPFTASSRASRDDTFAPRVPENLNTSSVVQTNTADDYSLLLDLLVDDPNFIGAGNAGRMDILRSMHPGPSAIAQALQERVNAGTVVYYDAHDSDGTSSPGGDAMDQTDSQVGGSIGLEQSSIGTFDLGPSFDISAFEDTPILPPSAPLSKSQATVGSQKKPIGIPSHTGGERGDDDAALAQETAAEKANRIQNERFFGARERSDKARAAANMKEIFAGGLGGRDAPGHTHFVNFELRDVMVSSRKLTFAKLLNYYDGADSEYGQKRSWSQEGGSDTKFELTREDVLSLYGSNWLTDEVISGILAVLFPDGACARNADCSVARPVPMLAMYTAMTLSRAMKMKIGTDEEKSAIAAELDAILQVYEQGGHPCRLGQLDPDVHAVVGVLNETDLHWIAFRADRNTHVITIYDSWVMDIPSAQTARQSAVRLRLSMLFKFFADHYLTQPGWASQPGIPGGWDGTWQVQHADPATLHVQTNSDDCGVHALRNLQDLVDWQDVLPYHDAQELRMRYVWTLIAVYFVGGEIYDSSINGTIPFAWGGSLPGEDELRMRWQTKPTSRPSATASTAVTKPGHAPVSNPSVGDKGLIERMLQNFTAEDFVDAEGNELPKPDLGTIIDRNMCAHVMLHYATIPMTPNQLALCFHAVCDQLGLQVKAEWNQSANKISTYLMGKAFNPAYSGIKRLRIEEGRTTKVGTQYQGVPGCEEPEHFTRNAVDWFGPIAQQHYADATHDIDDIETRPALLVSVYRLSRLGYKPGTITADYDTIGHRQQVSRENATYWDLVFNGRPSSPIEVEAAETLDPDTFSLFHYHIVSPSHLPVFENKGGNATPQDTTLIAMLEKLDEHSAQQSKEGDDRPLVTFLVVGVDGWTTDTNSLVALKDRFPHLRLRITMLMTADRVQRIPHVFRLRNHTSQDLDGFSWAHFNLDSVAAVKHSLATDPLARLPLHRRDQAALLHMCDNVSNFKALHISMGAVIGDNLITTQSDQDLLRDKAEDIGRILVDGLHRHSLDFPEMQKLCAICDTTVTTSWHRAPGNLTADVVCNDHFEAPSSESILSLHSLIRPPVVSVTDPADGSVRSNEAAAGTPPLEQPRKRGRIVKRGKAAQPRSATASRPDSTLPAELAADKDQVTPSTAVEHRPGSNTSNLEAPAQASLRTPASAPAESFTHDDGSGQESLKRTSDSSGSAVHKQRKHASTASATGTDGSPLRPLAPTIITTGVACQLCRRLEKECIVELTPWWLQSGIKKLDSKLPRCLPCAKRRIPCYWEEADQKVLKEAIAEASRKASQ
ncbi:hypothetical protein LTR95_011993 [Oleoguttula sp. CCFEE 5521]